MNIATHLNLKALKNNFKVIHRCKRNPFSVITNDIDTDIDENYKNPSASIHTYPMRLALRHAQHSFREKEVPIGAVIVNDEGKVIATGRNQIETLKDPTAHAEINCIRKASEVLGTWRLNNHTLYTTLEPCPMCLGAIQQARIKKVVYAAKDIRMGGLGSWIDMIGEYKHPFHQVEVDYGVLELESTTLLKKFFLLRRRESESNGLLDSYKNASIMIDRAYNFMSSIESD